jgi:hypothetical protein
VQDIAAVGIKHDSARYRNDALTTKMVLLVVVVDVDLNPKTMRKK